MSTHRGETAELVIFSVNRAHPSVRWESYKLPLLHKDMFLWWLWPWAREDGVSLPSVFTMPRYSSTHISTWTLLFKFQPFKPLGLDYIEIVWVTLHFNYFPAFALRMNCARFWCVERGWEVWKHEPWGKKHSHEGSYVGRWEEEKL